MSAASAIDANWETVEHWRSMLEVATCEVFEIVLGSSLEATNKVSNGTVHEYTAIVGLAGSMCGVITLRCTAGSAALMASKMLGVPIVEAGGQSRDAIGEVCNMIAGNFKTKLTNLASQCMLSVPTVITGADYQLHSLSEGATAEATLRFEDEILCVTLEVTATV
ncbi:MAG: chemotaxis protein CheX [Terriglobia bacterium]|jgi:chemotaxis protein CheX|nr:chemotaxis protein CheX [Terriglobia bacterium]